MIVKNQISKLLVANRGEIAVRVIRAARDAGLVSVAVYADPDADAQFVKLADESIALGGQTSADSYLTIDKILGAASQSGADAIHPGYGFLSENADFAEAVISAGITWIGPSPASIRQLGNKVTARHIAKRANAPMAVGTEGPVSGPGEVVEFAEKYGVPVAIKAAFGGGGRGLKVARTIEEIPDLFASATREAIAAFGRGECFVEQYLDKARHVEAQVVADQHGNIVVVGTRDCSLQRRFQKLVEEAPAPFLTDNQRAKIHESAKAICREAGYYGAGTVEYLVQGDTVSFLEVNTRLQVEHPVTEETTGIDLVRQQFKIAQGEVLDIVEDPVPRGHSIEFRINAEDPGRDFLPAPGPITVYRQPSGPGVRVDTGVSEGDFLGGQFDSMLAKLVVTGENRTQAIERARRALAEFEIEGLATTIPFHRNILSEPAFTGNGDAFQVYTKWIETNWKNLIEPYVGAEATKEHDVSSKPNFFVLVDGRQIEVSLPSELDLLHSGTVRRKPKLRKRERVAAGIATGDSVTAPMQGTVVKVAVEDSQTVSAGDLVVVLEAMKMENTVTAHKDGIISGLAVEVGSAVTQGTVLLEIK